MDASAQKSDQKWRMRALHVIKPNEFVQENVDVPVIVPGQALIRLDYGLVCGSDIPKFAGLWPDSPIPLKVGMPLHECVGVVEESAVDGLERGAQVLAIPNDEAGFSEFFVTSEDMIVPLHDWTEDDLPCAALGQPTSTVHFALDKLYNISGARVLVVGLGGIGMICAIVLKTSGAEAIVGIEPNDFRRKHAADNLDVDARSEWSDTMRGNFDIAIEAVGGSVFPETSGMCFDAVRPLGEVLLMGLPTVPNPQIPVRPIIGKNLHVAGSLSPPWGEYLPRGMQTVRDSLDKFRPMITQSFPWTEAAAAFELFVEKDAERIKILLESS